MTNPSGTHASQSVPKLPASNTFQPTVSSGPGASALVSWGGMGRCWLVGALTLFLIGCGPSFRRLQDSRVYFERCYAADFDSRIPLAEKHACWTAWLEHYTSGQPRERHVYARDRIFAIEQGESLPRLPGTPEAVVSTRVTPVISPSEEVETVAPAPANVDEEEMERPRPRARRREPPIPRTANPICAARACEAAWRTCVGRCPEDMDACDMACEVELQACARGCF